MRRIRIVDSHTGGEPTRLVLEGGPDLGRGSLAEQRERFIRDHDRFRSAIVGEPRSSDIVVGAILCEPEHEGSAAGVVFFNNVGCLGMCGHGTIGLIATLAHLGRLAAGHHRIDTPVGTVTAELSATGRITVGNVPSYRFRKGVSVEVPGNGRVTGDVAWGGNWFFLVEDHGLTLSPRHIDGLTDFTRRVRVALGASGITGENGGEIDHIELCAPSPVTGIDSRNFVLCPGGVYDRSPCGTGTSAKLACLHADGKLRAGEIWRQESIIGSVFEGSFSVDPERHEHVHPRITGDAFITGEGVLVLDEADPFCWGVPSEGGSWPSTS